MYLRREKAAVPLAETAEFPVLDQRMEDFVDMDAFHSLTAPLNERQRKVVSSKILGEMTHREIAQMLSIPTGTVQWLYATSIKKLHRALTTLASLAVLFGGGLFMGYVKTLEGFAPARTYHFTVSFKLATDVEGGLVGGGGSPGEGVTVKCGVTPTGPVALPVDNGGGMIYYRLNIDAGRQANSGKDMTVVGDMAKDVYKRQAKGGGRGGGGHPGGPPAPGDGAGGVGHPAPGRGPVLPGPAAGGGAHRPHPPRPALTGPGTA